MDISNENVIDLLDKMIIVLKNQDVNREQDIAIQKLEEAIFWLTYGTEE
jgi:hypothetical protein